MRDRWSMNGFSSESTMNETYNLVKEVMKDQIKSDTRILHLGCGNGELLSRIAGRKGKPVGIDSETKRLEQALLVCPTGMFFRSDIFNPLNFDPNPDVLIFMVERLRDTPERQETMIRQMRKTPKTVLYFHGRRAMSQSIFDMLHEFKVAVDFPSDIFSVKEVACTNESEAALLCPKRALD